MNKAIGLLVLLSVFSCAVNSQVNDQQKIIGGQAALKNAYPFMAAIISSQQVSITPICGASYIGERYMLTAAHCVSDMQASDIDVWIGGNDISIPSEGLRIAVQQIYINEEYDVPTSNKDIAILELVDVVTNIPAIKMLTPEIESSINEGDLFTIIGWGTTNTRPFSNDSPDILQETEVPLYNRADCLAAYPSRTNEAESTITEFMMCAGFVEGGKDTCQGDSGGPMIYRHQGEWYQAGVVSFGNGCAAANSPGIYSRVSQFETWLAQKQAGVSYQQNMPLGFVEEGYDANLAITISNLGDSAFSVADLVLQNAENLAVLNIVNNQCAMRSLASQQSCDVIVNAMINEIGLAQFTLSGTATNGVSSPIAITVNFQALPITPINIPEAADSNEYISWYSGGDIPWEVTRSRTANGATAIVSGAIDDLESSALLATITDPHIKSLRFSYAVSSEEDFDYLYVLENNALFERYSGILEATFSERSITLTPGTNRISFIFEKDVSVSRGEDKAYIDNVIAVWGNEQPVIVINQNIVTIQENSSFTLDASNTADPENDPLQFSWQVIGASNASIANPQSATTSITSPGYSNTLDMRVKLTVTDSFGATSEAEISINVTEKPPSSGGGIGGLYLALLWLTIVLRKMTYAHKKPSMVINKQSAMRLIMASFVFFAVVSISGCLGNGEGSAKEHAQMQSPSSTQPPASTAAMAQIYSAKFTVTGLRFLTISNGCTTTQSFSLSVAPSKNDALSNITIHRIKPDYCKAKSHMVAIELPLSFENTDNMRIVNPILPQPKLSSKR